MYFADSYNSWQREINKNINRLIRKFVHEKFDFSNINQIDIVENVFNNRLMKCLGYTTPIEIFNKFLG